MTRQAIHCSNSLVLQRAPAAVGVLGAQALAACPVQVAFLHLHLGYLQRQKARCQTGTRYHNLQPEHTSRMCDLQLRACRGLAALSGESDLQKANSKSSGKSTASAPTRRHKCTCEHCQTSSGHLRAGRHKAAISQRAARASAGMQTAHSAAAGPTVPPLRRCRIPRRGTDTGHTQRRLTASAPAGRVPFLAPPGDSRAPQPHRSPDASRPGPVGGPGRTPFDGAHFTAIGGR